MKTKGVKCSGPCKRTIGVKNGALTEPMYAAGLSIAMCLPCKKKVSGDSEPLTLDKAKLKIAEALNNLRTVKRLLGQ